MNKYASATIIIIAFLLPSCQSSKPLVTLTATKIPESIPTNTPELTPTNTPKPSSTLRPTQIITPPPTPTVEPHDLAITAQNAHQIVQLAQFGKKEPRSVDWSPDGTIIAVASYTDITIYDSETLEIIDVIDPNSRISQIAFSPNINHIFIVAREWFNVWDLNTGEVTESIGYIGGGIRDFSFSPDGKILAIAGPSSGGGGDPDYSLGIYNMATGEEIYTRQEYGGTGPVAVSAEGSWVAVVTEFRGLEIFNTRSGEIVKTIKPGPGRFLGYWLDDQTLVLCGDYIFLWDVATEESQRFENGDCDKPILSADGHKMAFVDQSGAIKILDTGNYQLTQTLVSHGFSPFDIAFSPSSDSLVSISYENLIVWDIESGENTNSLSGFTPRLYPAAFSPDSSIVIGIDYQDVVHAWDIESGELVVTTQTLPELPSDDNVISPDGKIRTATRVDEEGGYPWMEIIQLIDTDTDQILHELTGHKYLAGEGIPSSIIDMTFNWDGSILLTAGFDSTMRLWNVHTGELIISFQLPYYMSIALFSPDGRYLATNSGDGVIRLWGIPNE